jgi:hypothetical protein
VDNFQRLHNRVALRIFAALFLVGLLVIGTWWAGLYLLKFNGPQTLVLCVLIAASGSVLMSGLIARIVLEPLRSLSEAILHVSSGSDHAAPNLEKIRLGRELVSALAL